ncbi:hypothetical protein ZIOFF_043473 [Zingiber officinale]|uniref:HVA22-like protein n=1 Tax=Zingiber officinale TaxID=94328 RepID=A0A8J5GAN3_ZINOF|nr:hypothetical protein ZIOFF_043473 [Zingiber officinale]
MCMCYRLPFWPYAKLIFNCWLVLPYFSGATFIYENFVRPMVLNQQTLNLWSLSSKSGTFGKPDDVLLAAEKFIEQNGTEAFEKLISKAGGLSNPKKSMHATFHDDRDDTEESESWKMNRPCKPSRASLWLACLLTSKPRCGLHACGKLHACQHARHSLWQACQQATQRGTNASLPHGEQTGLSRGMQTLQAITSKPVACLLANKQATLWLACLPASHNVACMLVASCMLANMQGTACGKLANKPHHVARMQACHMASRQACHVACR